jgi:hypothetical protein
MYVRCVFVRMLHKHTNTALAYPDNDDDGGGGGGGYHRNMS